MLDKSVLLAYGEILLSFKKISASLLGPQALLGPWHDDEMMQWWAFFSFLVPWKFRQILDPTFSASFILHFSLWLNKKMQMKKGLSLVISLGHYTGTLP